MMCGGWTQRLWRLLYPAGTQHPLQVRDMVAGVAVGVVLAVYAVM